MQYDEQCNIGQVHQRLGQIRIQVEQMQEQRQYMYKYHEMLITQQKIVDQRQ